MSFLGLSFLEPSLYPPLFTQVSHHPPVSAFYVSNRKDGFCMSGSITAKSKFYGEEAPGDGCGMVGGLGLVEVGEDFIQKQWTPEPHWWDHAGGPNSSEPLGKPGNKGEACRKGLAPTELPNSIAISYHVWLFILIKGG